MKVKTFLVEITAELEEAMLRLDEKINAFIAEQPTGLIVHLLNDKHLWIGGNCKMTRVLVYYFKPNPILP